MKRRLFGAIAALALLAGCGGSSPPPASQQAPPPALVQPPPGSPVTLAVATDLHYLTPSLVETGEFFTYKYMTGDGKQLNYSEEITEAFIQNVLEVHPQTLILTGDLTVNGEKASHEALAEKLLRLREAGIQVLVLPGNHDINNAYAFGYGTEKLYAVDTVTPEEFAEIYRYCGFEGAVSRDDETLSYIAEVSRDLWVLVLDTNRYNETGPLYAPVTGGVLPESTLGWAGGYLKFAEENHITVITATHHNLMDHSPLLSEGFTLENAGEVVELFTRYGVPLNLSGHIHVQDIGRQETETGELYDISTSSLAVYDNQFGILDFVPGVSLDYRIQPVDVEGWAVETGSENPELLGFEDYSFEFYRNMSYHQSLNQLAYCAITEEEMAEMANTMGDLNPYYFSGRAEEIREEILASETYALWLSKGRLVERDYIDSMLKIPELSPTRLHIPLPSPFTQ